MGVQQGLRERRLGLRPPLAGQVPQQAAVPRASVSVEAEGLVVAGPCALAAWGTAFVSPMSSCAWPGLRCPAPCVPPLAGTPLVRQAPVQLAYYAVALLPGRWPVVRQALLGVAWPTPLLRPLASLLVAPLVLVLVGRSSLGGGRCGT